jgi:hypothetical protein
MRLSTIRALCLTLPLLLTPLLAVPAAAQYRPPSDPPTGEDYHVELAFLGWKPTPVFTMTSESLGILGTDVDLVNDLGIDSKMLWETRIVLRPARKHKFRVHYLPMHYTAETVVQREFIFNGLLYRAGLPVNTDAEIKTWRVGYEFDFIHRDWGYLGVLADLKFTDVNVQLESPLGLEFTKQAAPIPTFGGTARGYLTRDISLTGEVTFFKVPENLSEDYGGRYVDFDFYGTMNFTRNFGAQLGYRSIDVFYEIDFDRGDLQFRGWYLGGVLRF